MSIDEWMAKLDRDLQKMKINREKIPLDVLKQKYERAYNTLYAELECDADWFADMYLLTLQFPRHPEDAAGNEWLDKKINRIKEE